MHAGVRPVPALSCRQYAVHAEPRMPPGRGTKLTYLYIACCCRHCKAMALAHLAAAGTWQSAPQIAAAVEAGLPRQALAYGYLCAALFAGPNALCADPNFRAQIGSYWSIMPLLQVRVCVWCKSCACSTGMPSSFDQGSFKLAGSH